MEIVRSEERAIAFWFGLFELCDRSPQIFLEPIPPGYSSSLQTRSC
ncbi:hypothetical protein [Funiculus sociatus]